jgi:hypothetical protein
VATRLVGCGEVLARQIELLDGHCQRVARKGLRSPHVRKLCTEIQDLSNTLTTKKQVPCTAMYELARLAGRASAEAERRGYRWSIWRRLPPGSRVVPPVVTGCSRVVGAATDMEKVPRRLPVNGRPRGGPTHAWLYESARDTLEAVADHLRRPGAHDCYDLWEVGMQRGLVDDLLDPE